MFNDKAGEAMDFYASVFKNAKILSKMPGPQWYCNGRHDRDRWPTDHDF
jgi:predicted 3-demethylubiquinone-9 3-methyltransferase (glyoxalase superfamily)